MPLPPTPPLPPKRPGSWLPEQPQYRIIKGVDGSIDPLSNIKEAWKWISSA